MLKISLYVKNLRVHDRKSQYLIVIPSCVHLIIVMRIIIKVCFEDLAEFLELSLTSNKRKQCLG